jgi:hypothetical protein
MNRRSRRRSLAVAVGAFAVLVVGAASTANAQVKCYIKKCVEYPDGTSFCERTPVDCATIQI